jgi:hypothetical protein
MAIILPLSGGKEEVSKHVELEIAIEWPLEGSSRSKSESGSLEAAIEWKTGERLSLLQSPIGTPKFVTRHNSRVSPVIYLRPPNYILSRRVAPYYQIYI